MKRLDRNSESLSTKKERSQKRKFDIDIDVDSKRMKTSSKRCEPVTNNNSVESTTKVRKLVCSIPNPPVY